MRREGIAGVIAFVLIAAAGGLAAIGVPALTYRDGDFLQFWIQPQAWLEGASPYDPVWWATVHARVGARALFPQAVYPPYDALAFLPLAFLPLSLAAAIWLVAQLAAVGAVALRLARRSADRGTQLVFLALVASAQPLWLLVVGGNVTGLLFAAAGGAYLAARRGQIGRCGALLGLLIVKPHLFLFLGVAALVAAERAERRALFVGGLAVGAPLIGLTAALRPAWYAQWLPSALSLQAAPGSNATAWTIGRLIGVDSPLPGALLVAALIAGFVIWARRARPALGTVLAAAIPVSLAVAPHGWSYDQLLLLVPLAALFERLALRPAGSRRRGVALAALAAVALPWMLYALAFRRAGEELSVLTPLLLLAAYWRVEGELPRPAVGRSIQAPILP